MRCPILIGREEPAALIAGAVSRLAGPGRGGALVVTGEAGIGKSRLAGHMSDLAARAGVRVVTGRALPAGIGGPLGPVCEVVMVQHAGLDAKPAVYPVEQVMTQDGIRTA